MFSDSEWVRVPPAQARHHPLYGVGGWLVMVALGLALASVGQVVLATSHQVAQAGGEADLAGASGQIRSALSWLLAVGWLGAFYLLLSCSRLFPGAALAMAGTSVALPLIEVVALQVVLGMDADVALGRQAAVHGTNAMGVFLIQAVAASALVAYLARSRRVAVTFDHRVRPNEAAAFSPTDVRPVDA